MTKTQGHPRWAERTLLHKGGTAATWGNLGLWDEATPDYAAACAALARRVAQAAGDRVLSVGCGAGDELQLWRDEFGAAEVVGVESDPELRTAGQALAGVTVHLGSGTALGRWACRRAASTAWSASMRPTTCAHAAPS